MEPWTQHAWDTDRSPWTLWIIRDSFLNSTISDNILTATAPGSGVEVLALVGDEGHISFRSNTSIRVDSFRQIGLHSGLVCLLRGCYGASPGALGRDSATLGGLVKEAGELGRGC
jgi:hypothetical protein